MPLRKSVKMILISLVLGIIIGVCFRGLLSPSISELGIYHFWQPYVEDREAFLNKVEEEGRITFYGAWREVNASEVEYPSVSIVDCRREPMECAWTQAFPNAWGKLYSEIAYFPIQEWTRERIVAVQEDECARSTLMIELHTDGINQEDVWNPSAPEDCGDAPEPGRASFVLDGLDHKGFTSIRQTFIDQFRIGF